MFLESWQFYDRIFKGRITFSDGKVLVVDKGHLYLGRKLKIWEIMDWIDLKR